MRGSATLVVDHGDTATALKSGDVEVLGTPRLIALCEEATMAALADAVALFAGAEALVHLVIAVVVLGVADLKRARVDKFLPVIAVEVVVHHPERGWAV